MKWRIHWTHLFRDKEKEEETFTGMLVFFFFLWKICLFFYLYLEYFEEKQWNKIWVLKKSWTCLIDIFISFPIGQFYFLHLSIFTISEPTISLFTFWLIEKNVSCHDQCCKQRPFGPINRPISRRRWSICYIFFWLIGWLFLIMADYF